MAKFEKNQFRDIWRANISKIEQQIKIPALQDFFTIKI